MPEIATNTHPVRDQILIQEAQVLRGVTRLNGYQVDVLAVYEHHESTVSGIKEYPALRVVDQGDHFIRRHGGMYEAQISVAIWCYFREYDRENAKHLLRQMGADCQKALQADEFVTGLAFWTQWQNISTRVNDASQPDQLAVVVGEIGYRTKLEDPYTLWYF